MNALSFILHKNNIDNEVCTEVKPEYDNDEYLWLCIWTGIAVFPKKYILYNFDPLQHAEIESKVRSVLEKTTVTRFVNYYSTQRPAIVDPIPFSILPFGYAEYYETIGTVDVDCPDPDVLFIGSVNGRRLIFFNNLVVTLPGKRIVVAGTVFDQRVKTSLIRKAKIILSVANFEPSTYNSNDLARMSEVISNKGFMICEPVGDIEVESKLSKYVTYCQIEEIPERIAYYLEHEDERNAKSLEAYTGLKKEFNLETDFLNLIKTDL